MHAFSIEENIQMHAVVQGMRTKDAGAAPPGVLPVHLPRARSRGRRRHEQ